MNNFPTEAAQLVWDVCGIHLFNISVVRKTNYIKKNTILLCFNPKSDTLHTISRCADAVGCKST